MMARADRRFRTPRIAVHTAILALALAAAESGATVVVHCCAPNLPFDVLRSVPVQALSFDLSLLAESQYDDLGEWLDSGRAGWPGVVPAVDPVGDGPTEIAFAA